MIGRIPISIIAVTMVATLWAPGRAAADAIDGNWCADQGGQHMSIAGPRIVTPGGLAMRGNYSRHGFSYVVPVSEPGAGHQVAMVLVSDDLIHLRREQGPVEIWRRCELVS